MVKTPSSTPSNVPDYREIEIPVSIETLKEFMEPLLYQLGYVKDDEEILKLKSNITSPVMVTVCLKRQQQVEVIQH